MEIAIKKFDRIEKEKRIESYRKQFERYVPREVTNYVMTGNYFNAPASTRFHGAYEGGLYDHCEAVTHYLVYLTQALGLKWKNSSSPYVIGLLHDLCKVDLYEQYIDTDGINRFRYRKDTPAGHGDRSVEIAKSFMSLTEEEEACIRYHMGAFTDKEEWKSYTDAVPRYPNVLWTHTADMYASHILGK